MMKTAVRNTHVRPCMVWSDFVLKESDDQGNVTGCGSLTKDLYLPWQKYQILQLMIGAKAIRSDPNGLVFFLPSFGPQTPNTKLQLRCVSFQQCLVSRSQRFIPSPLKHFFNRDRCAEA